MRNITLHRPSGALPRHTSRSECRALCATCASTASGMRSATISGANYKINKYDQPIYNI